MKCPFCGKRRARLNPDLLSSDGLLIDAIDCRNSKCEAYNPVAFGYRTDMLPEHHQTYEKFRRVMNREGDL